MKYLLDTHTLIWFLNGDKRLPSNALDLIKNWSNDCLVSIATIWEIAIKVQLEKLELRVGFNDLEATILANRIDILPLSFEHFLSLLKLKNHHRDPFDRIIISQAIVEDFIIITKDENFIKYPVKVLWK